MLQNHVEAMANGKTADRRHILGVGTVLARKFLTAHDAALAITGGQCANAVVKTLRGAAANQDAHFHAFRGISGSYAAGTRK
jgi:hypothetical protein